MLKPHQLKASSDCLERLETHGVAILEGECRAGKTFVALQIGKTIGRPTLFLTRKKAISSVVDDREAIGIHPRDCYVINYESAHKAPDEDWGLIILDECHSGISAYPKPSGVWLKVRALFERTKAKALLMSGTVCIESKAQLFMELKVTTRGPWAKWSNFYHWWHQQGHYRAKESGGYGIAGATKRIHGGKEIADYAQVDKDRIEREVSPYVVTVSREDAGFKVTQASVKVVKATNGAILSLCDEIMKEGIARVGDRLCVYETPAAKLQGCHMACGGTLLDDQGEGFTLPDEFSPRYKVDLIRSRAKAGLKYVVFCHYIYERSFLISELGDACCDTLEGFEQSEHQFCVLSTTSYSMGVDLSWVSGCQIMYSMPWSGAVWSQVLDRQLRWDREREAVVAVVLLDGGVDETCYDVLRKKQNFNIKRFYAATRKPDPIKNYQIP